MVPRKIHFDKDFLSKKLYRFNSPSRLNLTDEEFTKGAVTFLILPNKDMSQPYNLVLIKRTKRDGDKHSGEMAFPGGKFENGIDANLIDTALRETEEELGIPRNKIEILGALNDHVTPTFFIISPIVASIKPGQPMVMQKSEVKEIVIVPITFFLDKRNYIERILNIDGNRIAVGRYVYQSSANKKYVIFGATSHLIVHFIQRIYGLNFLKSGCRRISCEDVKRTSH
ncbi:MAG: putative Nudix hydrolase NudL [Promethearchaeota archaeon]|nr:MAG: putative Nudix hydrolase NudL [Candidatus Lokiarchaeota archaeon]